MRGRISRVKWFYIVCFMMILVCWRGMDVSAEETEIDTSAFKYEENADGTINVTDCNEKEETLVIPSEIDGKRVRAVKLNFDNDRWESECQIKRLVISEGIRDIMRNAFYNCKSLEQVVFPSTLKMIGDYAFSDCVNIKYVNLPEGLIDIGKEAFHGCRSLESISFPRNLKKLGECAFFSCSSLLKITVPGSLKTISRGVFYNCSSLHEVELEEGVTTIENIAFLYCNKLQKITIPKSVTYIDNSAFATLNPLTNGIIYADPNSYARIFAQENKIKFMCLNTHLWDNGTVADQSSLGSGKKKYTCTYRCIACGKQKTGQAAIPKKGKKSEDSISKHVYKVTRTGLKNGTVEFVKTRDQKNLIIIPDKIKIDGISYKVTSIGKNAFKDNKNIKRITVGKHVTEIKANAFRGCRNLSSIIIQSKNLQRVGKGALKGIQAKAKIKVPSNKLEGYKKILSKKGQKLTVRITE
ncbi:MAG: leucine-rich repeat protein [Eubacterium sp.]|nr:leucine-rich repeat protein [Eubacterium sp.]